MPVDLSALPDQGTSVDLSDLPDQVDLSNLPDQGSDALTPETDKALKQSGFMQGLDLAGIPRDVVQMLGAGEAHPIQSEIELWKKAYESIPQIWSAIHQGKVPMSPELAAAEQTPPFSQERQNIAVPTVTNLALMGAGIKAGEKLTALRRTPLQPETPPIISRPGGTTAVDVAQAMQGPGWEKRFQLVPEPRPTLEPAPSMEQTIAGAPAEPYINVETGQPFFPEIGTQLGVPSETARIGGKPDASRITSAASVPELEVRPQVGEEAPLRQPGETPQAQEPVSTGASVAPETPAADEKIALAAIKTPDGRVFTGVNHADAAQKSGSQNWEGGFVTNKGRYLTSKEAYALADKGMEVVTPEIVAFDEKMAQLDKDIPPPEPVAPTPVTAEVGGPSIRAVSKRPIEAPPPGTIRGWEQATAHGENWLNQGGDINKVVTDFRKTGKVNELEMGKMNAYLNRLQSVTNQAGDALRIRPNDPKLQQAYQQAVAAEQTFTEAYKPMHTVASGSLAALQGHVPLTEEAAASFTGLSRRFQEFKGKPMSPEEVVKADKLSKQMEKANTEYKQANGELYKRLDTEYGRIRTPRKGPPTLNDLARSFGETLDEVCDV